MTQGRRLLGVALPAVLLFLFTAPSAMAQADLSVTKTVSNQNPVVGEQFSYHLTVTNGGPAAANVQMQDPLPPTVRFVNVFGPGCGHDGAPSGGTVTCAQPSVPSGGSAGIVITVEAVSQGSTSNCASVSTNNETDPNSGNNTSCVAGTASTRPPPPSADLRVQGTQSNDTPRQGEEFTYTVTAFNDGPGTANNARITGTLPTGVEFVSYSGPIPCSHSEGVVTCDVPQFPPGFSGSGEVRVRAVRDGPMTSTVSIGSDTPDPNEANNFSTLDGAILPPSAPEAGETVNVQVLSGEVFIKRPASASGAHAAQAEGFRKLEDAEQIEVGSLVDVSKGKVRMTAAADKRGSTATGDFTGAVFGVGQKATRRPITDLRLRGGNFAPCGSASSAGATTARRIRRLSGSARGRFRTRGRHSSATVRGTKWYVEDRCDGTLTKVQSGKVVVRDFARKRNVTLRTGQRYFARPRGR